MADFNLDVALENENLTSDEKSLIREINSRNAITTEDGFKKAIEEAQKEYAIATSQKSLLQDGVLQLEADEIKRAWDIIEKNKNDETLKHARTDMQTRSEEAMELAEEILNGGEFSDNVAMDMQEWLEINKSCKNSQNKSRNKKIGKVLQKQLDEFDCVNGLEGISAKDVAKIQETQNEIDTQTKNYNPLAKDQNGQTKPLFKDIAQFYDNLQIQDDDGQKKAEFIKNMVELARQEAINQLSLDSKFRNKGDQEKFALIVSTWKSTLEQGVASIIIAQESVDAGERFNDAKFRKTINKKGMAADLSTKFKEYIAEGKPLTIKEDVANGVCAARLQIQSDFNKRLTQKTGHFNFISKARARINRFKEKHPKITAIMKVLGTVSLTVGVGMVGGAAGMAALGVYRTCKAYRKGVKECGSFKKMLKSPKHMVGLATAVASTVIAGYGVAELGNAANGMLGNMGVGGTIDAFKDMASNAASATWHVIMHPADSASSLAKGVWHGAKWTYNHLTDGNFSNSTGKVGKFLADSWHNLLHPSATVDAAAASGNETARVLATQRVGRLFVGVGSSMATFSMDVTKALKQKGGKAKTKAILKAFGKALGIGALTVGAYEYGTHLAASADHNGVESGTGGKVQDGDIAKAQGTGKVNSVISEETEQKIEKIRKATRAVASATKSVAENQIASVGEDGADEKLKESIKFKTPEGDNLIKPEDFEKIEENKDLPKDDVQAENQPKMPSHKQMRDLSDRIEEIYQDQEQPNLGTATQKAIRESVKDGNLTEDQAVRASKIVSDVAQDEGGDPEQTIKAIRKGATAMMQEDTESVVEPEPEPIVEPVVEPEAEPVVEPVAEPEVEPIVESMVEPEFEPVVEPEAEPVVESVAEPEVEPIVESMVEPEFEPVVEPEVKPVAEPEVEPIVESMVEPEVKPVAEPEAEPVVEPETQAKTFTEVKVIVDEDQHQFTAEQTEKIKQGNFDDFIPSVVERSAFKDDLPEAGSTMKIIAKALQISRNQGTDFNISETMANAGIAKDDPFALFYENFGKQISKDFTNDDLHNFILHYSRQKLGGDFPETYINKEESVIKAAVGETKNNLEDMKNQLSSDDELRAKVVGRRAAAATNVEQTRESWEEVKSEAPGDKNQILSDQQRRSQEAMERINQHRPGEDELSDEARHLRIKNAATISLDKADSLESNQVIIAKDKLGNEQIVGRDENGNVFKVTRITNYGNPSHGTTRIEGSDAWYELELPENSPLYKELDAGFSGIESRFPQNDEMDREMEEWLGENSDDKYIENDPEVTEMEDQAKATNFYKSIARKIKQGTFRVANLQAGNTATNSNLR